MTRWEILHRPPHQYAVVFTRESFFWGQRERIGSKEFFVKFRRRVLRTILMQPGIAGVADDLEHPGADIPPSEATEKSEGPHEGFLHHVLRILVVAGQPARQVISGIEMRYDI